jgi:hypothetical protein
MKKIKKSEPERNILWVGLGLQHSLGQVLDASILWVGVDHQHPHLVGSLYQHLFRCHLHFLGKLGIIIILGCFKI